MGEKKLRYITIFVLLVHTCSIRGSEENLVEDFDPFLEEMHDYEILPQGASDHEEQLLVELSTDVIFPSTTTIESEHGSEELSSQEQTTDITFLSTQVVPSTVDKIEGFTEGETCSPLECKDDQQEDKKIERFIDSFRTLKDGLDKLMFGTEGESVNTVLFVGNTGSGKSTLVQLITGDNNKLIAKETFLGSGEFVIVDEGKISRETIVSKTLYPEMNFDNETGIWIFDNPGFKDTRGPEYEIITTYAMKKILKKTKNIKIVLTITHASLQKGMYREDFINLLHHLFEFVKDIRKYKDSTYIMATKTENTMIKRGKSYVLLSDQTLIKNIASFLTEVRESISKASSSYFSVGKEAFYQNSSILLDSILSKKGKDNNYERINIFRRPQEEGELSRNEIIQTERKSIRKMLLNVNNFVEASIDDFGYTISDSSKLFLNDLFKTMDEFVSSVTEDIALRLSFKIKEDIGNTRDIESIFSYIDTNKKAIKETIERKEAYANPKEFSKNLLHYLKTIHLSTMHINSTISFYGHEIDLLSIMSYYDYLGELELMTPTEKYTPTIWRSKLEIIEEYLESELSDYKFLKSLYETLSSYRIQKIKSSFLPGHLDISDIKMSKIKLSNLTEKIGLDIKQPEVLRDSKKIEIINDIINLTLFDSFSISCENEEVVIFGNLIRSSEIVVGIKSVEKECSSAKRFLIIASITFFMDADLDGVFFKGKDMVLMAPLWKIRGVRRISLDGSDPPGDTTSPAGVGQIGRNGQSGQPGGDFIGVGIQFENGDDLTVSAKGGNGQKGQDGGDGRDGVDGLDASIVHGSDGGNVGNDIIPKFFGFQEETKLVEGTQGTPGLDSGAGGKGGSGGAGGSVLIINLGGESHKISTITEMGRKGEDGHDGIPGKGGRVGCADEFKVKKLYFLSFSLWSSKEKVASVCNTRRSSGSVNQAYDSGLWGLTRNSFFVHQKKISVCDYRTTFTQRLHPLLSNLLTFRLANNTINSLSTKLRCSQ